jgi:hypothetical protein
MLKEIEQSTSGYERASPENQVSLRGFAGAKCHPEEQQLICFAPRRFPPKRIGTLLLLMFLSTCVSAQILDPSSSGRPQVGDPDFDPSIDRRATPQEQREELPDTFGIFVYQVENPNDEDSWRDSLLDQFQRYEPARKIDFDFATTGQLGGAAYPLMYRPILRRGTELGFRQFDLYQVDGESLDYYRLERPFTYLAHVRENQQEDTWTTAKFSRNFADGVNLVLDYTRIAQLSRQGQYPSQSLRNTHVATAFSVRPPGSRYSGYFSYAANTYEQLQNGGIVPASIEAANENGGEVNNLQNLQPFLENTRMRHSYRQWMATQSLQFGGTRDTISGEEKRAFTLTHRLRLDNRRYRLSSEFAAQDTNFFNFYPDVLLDPRGVRNQIEHKILENSINLSTFRRGKSGERATVQKDLLEVGVTHILHQLDQEPGDSTINNLLLTGKLGLRPSDRLRLLISGQLNVVGQTGDYRISGEGELDLGNAGKLELRALNQLYAPDVVQQTYRLNGIDFWDNDFAKTLELRLEGAYTLPVVKIKAGLAYSLLTNYVYFGEDGRPQQADGLNSILQLTAERRLNFGNWRLDNRLLLQQADQAVFRLPQIYGEHSLYLSGKWFKVLNVNLGFDFRFATGFRPYYYNPILQQFHLQESQETGLQYQVDPFFSMRVTRFRFFLKYVQLQSLWNGGQLVFLTAQHPFPNQSLRFGVSWRLLD